MKRFKIGLVAALLGLVGVGCGAENPIPERGQTMLEGVETPEEVETAPPESTHERSVRETTLDSFEAGEETVSFVEYTTESGERTLMLREEASAYQAQVLSELLLEQEGTLTLLEMFYAMAPAGSVPSERLVESHAEEVVAMGRTDASITMVDFDVNQPILKTAAACDDYTYFDPPQGTAWVNKSKKNNQTGFSSLCLYDNCGAYSNDFVKAAVCNDSGGSISAQNAWGYSNVDGGAWNYTSWVTVGSGNKVNWTISFTFHTKRYAAIGSSTNAYRLRTGVLANGFP